MPQQGHFDWEYQKYDGLVRDFDDIVEEVDEFRVTLEGPAFHKYVVGVQFQVIGNQPPGGNGWITKNKASLRPSTYLAKMTLSTAASYTPTSSDKKVESAQPVASTQTSSMAAPPEKGVSSSHTTSSRPQMQGLTLLKMTENNRTPDKLTLDKRSSSLEHPLKMKLNLRSPSKPSTIQDRSLEVSLVRKSSSRVARSELQFKIYDPASIKPKTATTAPSELGFPRVEPIQGQPKTSVASSFEKSVNPFKPISNKPKPSISDPPQPEKKEKKPKQAKRPNPDTNKSTAEYETTSQLLDKILALNEENAKLQKENDALKKAVRVRSTTNRGLEGELAEAKARLERKVREFAERGLSDSEEEIAAKGGLARNKRRRV